MKMPKILFFIAGMAPTHEESEAALEIGAVAMRNRSLIGDTDNPEACDAVAGEVIPPPYVGKPVVKTLANAMTIIRDKQKAANATAAKFLADGAAGSEKPGGGASQMDGKAAEGSKLGGGGSGAGSPAGGGATPITQQKPGAGAPGWKANA